MKGKFCHTASIDITGEYPNNGSSSSGSDSSSSSSGSSSSRCRQIQRERERERKKEGAVEEKELSPTFLHQLFFSFFFLSPLGPGLSRDSEEESRVVPAGFRGVGPGQPDFFFKGFQPPSRRSLAHIVSYAIGFWTRNDQHQQPPSWSPQGILSLSTVGRHQRETKAVLLPGCCCLLWFKKAFQSLQTHIKGRHIKVGILSGAQPLSILIYLQNQRSAEM